jgi:hypothetical protein
MNLHSIVSGAVGAVNPQITISLQSSTGSTTNADGSRTPAYAEPVSLTAQVQPLTNRDLRQIEGLNLQGTLMAIYINGNLDGVVRVLMKGGDLITLPDGSVWLISQVLEGFALTAGWTKAVMTLQDGS